MLAERCPKSSNMLGVTVNSIGGRDGSAGMAGQQCQLPTGGGCPIWHGVFAQRSASGSGCCARWGSATGRSPSVWAAAGRRSGGRRSAAGRAPIAPRRRRLTLMRPLQGRGPPSWQRPTNEQTNGIPRRWLPKSTDPNIGQPRLSAIEDRINNMPRKPHQRDSAQTIYKDL